MALGSKEGVQSFPEGVSAFCIGVNLEVESFSMPFHDDFVGLILFFAWGCCLLVNAIF